LRQAAAGGVAHGGQQYSQEDGEVGRVQTAAALAQRKAGHQYRA
jgi:hypothetical protein